MARQLGIRTESLQSWVRQAEIAGGLRPTTSTQDERIAALERENRGLRRAGANCGRPTATPVSSGGIQRAAAGHAVLLSVHPIRFGSKVRGPAISPLDLVDIGLVKAEEARDQHAMETAAVATSQ